MERFTYLGDVFSIEEVVHEAVISRIRSAWKSLRMFVVSYARKVFHLELRKHCTNAMLEAL